MIEITDIEQAIIDKLKLGLPYLKTVDTLPSFLAVDPQDIPILCPAAYVSYSGGDYQAHLSAQLLDRSMEFEIVVIVRHPVKAKKMLHGTATRAGIYDVLEDVRTALFNQTLGLDIMPFLPVSEHAIAGDSMVAAYGITFSTQCRG